MVNRKHLIEIPNSKDSFLLDQFENIELVIKTRRYRFTKGEDERILIDRRINDLFDWAGSEMMSLAILGIGKITMVDNTLRITLNTELQILWKVLYAVLFIFAFFFFIFLGIDGLDDLIHLGIFLSIILLFSFRTYTFGSKKFIEELKSDLLKYHQADYSKSSSHV